MDRLNSATYWISRPVFVPDCLWDSYVWDRWGTWGCHRLRFQCYPVQPATFGYPLSTLRYILWINLNGLVILLTPWSSASYFLNSTGSSASSSRFSPFIGIDFRMNTNDVLLWGSTIMSNRHIIGWKRLTHRNSYIWPHWGGGESLS